MPRIRYLKPDFFKDEDIAKLPPLLRLFYAGRYLGMFLHHRLEQYHLDQDECR